MPEANAHDVLEDFMRAYEIVLRGAESALPDPKLVMIAGRAYEAHAVWNDDGKDYHWLALPMGRSWGVSFIDSDL